MGSQSASQNLNPSKVWVGCGSSEQVPLLLPFESRHCAVAAPALGGSLCPSLFLGFGKLTCHYPELVPLVGPRTQPQAPLPITRPDMHDPIPRANVAGWGNWEWGLSRSLTT